MTVTAITAYPAAGPASDRDAALRMLRADAIEYVTKLFDWLGEEDTGLTFVWACHDATEKYFHEVLAQVIRRAEENDFTFNNMCRREYGCRCVGCRYPAAPPGDRRAPWTQLMDNVRSS